MELIKFLISYFIKEFGDEKVAALFEYVKENNFDLKRLIANFNPALLEPIIQTLSSLHIKNSPSHSDGDCNGLNPIIGIADLEVVSCLNNYFGQLLS